VQNSSRKSLTLPLRLAIIILIIGALFKIMNWPYGYLLILIGSCAIMVLYTIRFLYKNKKSRLDYVKFGLVFLWVINYFNQVLHVLNIPFIFEISVSVFSIWWLMEEGLSYFSKRKFKRNKGIKLFYYVLITMTICCLVFGTLFKIQHWPYGALLFTFGILFLSLVIIVDYLVFERS
jgi:hypothetical protein